MIYEMTVQIRVSNIEEGRHWYESFLKRKPDFIPHEGFVEWELVPGSWLQVAEGRPSEGSGPLRIGVVGMEKERERVIQELGVEFFEIYSREEVPVKWGTFSDPWGNWLGFFEYVSETEKTKKVDMRLGKPRI